MVKRHRTKCINFAMNKEGRLLITHEVLPEEYKNIS